MRRRVKQITRASRSSRLAPDYLLVETGESRTPGTHLPVMDICFFTAIFKMFYTCYDL